MANPESVHVEAVMSGLTRQLIVWAQDRPRTYAEAMEAWSSWCPKLSVWEDALHAGLIEVVPAPGQGMAGARVRLTPSGQAALAA